MIKLAKILDWTTTILFCAIVLLDTFYVTKNSTDPRIITITFVAGAILIIGCLFICWYCQKLKNNNYENDATVNLCNDVAREVTVYNGDGNFIKQYSGNLDITIYETHYLLVDENGKQHIIDNPTDTVIIDEI